MAGCACACARQGRRGQDVGERCAEKGGRGAEGRAGECDDAAI